MIDVQQVIQHMRDYLAAGVSVLPIRLDGSKAPAIRKWKPYMSELPKDGQLTVWQLQKETRQGFGIGMVCGAVSGGLEVLDFDHNADENFWAWRRMIPPAVHGKLCAVETGGGGYHVIYRCDRICGNQKIAMEADGKGVLIESRGQGGYIVAVGSPLETHRSQQPYTQVMGRPLPEVPQLTIDERKAIWAAAATFDQRDPEAVRAEFVQKRIKQLSPPAVVEVDTSKPWHDFDARASWQEILGSAGWTTTDGIQWARPGKKAGTSAKVVCSESTGNELLTVFSGNAGPLAPKGSSAATWGKFNAFVEIAHGGDRSAAAKAALAMGYGGPRR